MKFLGFFSKLSTRNILTALVITSFCVSLLYSFYHKIHPVVDAKSYDLIAKNLVAGDGFKEDASLSYEFDSAIIRAGPGYEFFLAGLYLIFGHSYEIVWVAQALLHSLTTLFIFLIAVKIFPEMNRWVGISAAIFIGLSPDLIEISAMLMTETLYLFLTTVVLYLFVTMYSKPSTYWLSLALGLVLGIAILTRPPLLFFIPVIAWFLFFQKEYRSLAIFIGSVVVVLAPWVARNYFIYHQIILTTLIGEYNIWVGNTLLSDGGQISGGFNPLTTYTTANGFYGLKTKAGVEFFVFVTTYPFVFIKLCFIRFIRFFSLIRPMGFWFYQSGLSQLLFVGSSLVYGLPLFVVGYSGLTKLFFSKKGIFKYLCVLSATSAIALIPTVVQSRYRFQIYPFLAISAGYMFNYITQNKWWREKVILYTVLFLLIVSFFDILVSFSTIMERLDSIV